MDPGAPPATTSANWKGYTEVLHLGADGRLTLVRFDYANRELPSRVVNERITGDFSRSRRRFADRASTCGFATGSSRRTPRGGFTRNPPRGPSRGRYAKAPIPTSRTPRRTDRFARNHVRRAQPGDDRATPRLGKSTSARTAGNQRKYAFIAPTTPRADPKPLGARLTGGLREAHRSGDLRALFTRGGAFKPFAAAPQTRTGPTMPDASADPTPMERRLMGGATPILPVGAGRASGSTPHYAASPRRAPASSPIPATSPLSCGQSRMGRR